MTAMPTPSLSTVAFIGGGNMGSAIMAGLAALSSPPTITVCDPVAEVRERHAAAGRRVSATPEAAANSELIVLAVKPQQAASVLAELAPVLDQRHLVVSILAGTTTSSIADGLADGVRIVRSMPNTPMAIGQGMVGIAPGPGASEHDLDLAEALFSGAAKVLRTSEDRLDAVTAVSGSGPAYLFQFAESLVAGARDLGFSADEAALLVGETISGSIAYLQSQAGFPAAELRRQVTSPGGTTAAALATLAAADFDTAIRQALRAAHTRALELAAK